MIIIVFFSRSYFTSTEIVTCYVEKIQARHHVHHVLAMKDANRQTHARMQCTTHYQKSHHIWTPFPSLHLAPFTFNLSNPSVRRASRARTPEFS